MTTGEMPDDAAARARPAPGSAPEPPPAILEPRRTGLWARSHGFLYALDLTKELPPLRRAPGEVRRLQPAEVPGLRQVMGPDGTLIEPRRATGRECYILAVDRQIASYCWVAYEDEGIGAFERKIRLDPGEAYIFDCATPPPFRGRGFYPAVLGRMARELKARGCSLVWIGTDLENIASQRGIAKAGFTRIAEVRYWRLLGWERLELRPDPAAPTWLVDKARRALTPPGPP